MLKHLPHCCHHTRLRATLRKPLSISSSVLSQRTVVLTMCSDRVQTVFTSEEEKQAFIAKRIEESRKKRANRRFEYCPACNGGVGTRQKLMLHLKRCCKDLLTEYKLSNVDDSQKFAEFLQAISSKESELKSRALFLRYSDPTRSRRRTIEEVAAVMGLPLDRTERLIKKASKEIPLAKDDISVEVLYEDDFLLAVQKPPYITTTPKHRFQGGALFSRVFGYLGSEPYGLHRLDMNTSGVVLFSKDAESAEAVNVQFRRKVVKKAYLAICLGCPNEAEFVAETNIEADPDHEVAQRVSLTDGKWAKTSFTVLDSNADITLIDTHTGTGSNFSGPDTITGACLLLCVPLTGRTHQIRLHSAHSGHCIIGDDIYGILGPWIGRQALHAFQIEFKHPSTEQEIRIQAPPPDDFQKALEALRLRVPRDVYQSTLSV